MSLYLAPYLNGFVTDLGERLLVGGAFRFVDPEPGPAAVTITVLRGPQTGTLD